MRRFFDFTCTKCENTFEELIDNDLKVLPCPECSGDAVRQLAAPRSDWRKMGLDADGFPSAGAKWARAHRTHHKEGKETMRGGKGQNLLMY